MTEEINQEMTNVTNLKSGDTVRGKVTKIEDKEALVDIGYKYDGILPIGEISSIHIENIHDAFQVGDEFDLKVIKIDDEKEKLILSKKVIDSEKAWERLKGLHDSMETFEVKVADVVKGGLIADVGVRGFIPASLVETHFVEDFSDYKGKTLRVRVIELDTEKNKVILSQKVVLEDEEEKRKQEAFKDIKVGDQIEGTVQRLTDFGAFVDIGGIDGLVHISEISWERVKKPSDALKVGDKVKVKVLKIDKETKRISLSIRETAESPWEKVARELKAGEIYTGKIKRLTGFGAFVELSPGVEGLVHISQISEQHITKPDEVLKVDQEVKVKILDIDTKEKRISLSIKDAAEKEYENLEYDNQGLNVTLGDLFGDKLNKLK